jgi:hypothetical protein
MSTLTLHGNKEMKFDLGCWKRKQERSFKYEIGDVVVHKSNPKVPWCISNSTFSYTLNAYALRRVTGKGKLVETGWTWEQELELFKNET